MELLSLKSSLTLAAGTLLLAMVAVGQDHAPTVQQCRADQRLWSNQLEADVEKIKGLTFRQITERSEEMADCMSVDRERNMPYAVTVAGLSEHLMSRMYDFIKRHELLEKFKAEDAAGER